MTKLSGPLIACAMLLAGAGAQAQSEGELERQARADEARMRANEVEAQEIDARMREAEAQLAEAARQIAELSQRQMPRVGEMQRRVFIDRSRPVLGVNIGTGDEHGPVEGVEIVGVSPGGAADEAGLRAGDVIISINGESLSASNGAEAGRMLVDFMKGVEEGDRLDIDYLRDGRVQTVAAWPRSMSATLFSHGGPSFDVHVDPGSMAMAAEPFTRSFLIAGGSWGDMEMVPLTERLGSYFGTDDGLLVVRAPDDESLQLEDGDVIQTIGGRQPKSVSHAMRILGSYQAGEELEIVIMRDKKKRTLKIEMPDNRTGSLENFRTPAAGSFVLPGR